MPANLVAKHVSPPLSEDVYITLKVSDNLHAVLMPYMWAIYKKHATQDYLQTGFALEAQLLRSAGLDVSQAAQQDGEGQQRLLYPRLYGALPRVGANAELVSGAPSRSADHGRRRHAGQISSASRRRAERSSPRPEPTAAPTTSTTEGSSKKVWPATSRRAAGVTLRSRSTLVR